MSIDKSFSNRTLKLKFLDNKIYYHENKFILVEQSDLQLGTRKLKDNVYLNAKIKSYNPEKEKVSIEVLKIIQNPIPLDKNFPYRISSINFAYFDTLMFLKSTINTVTESPHFQKKKSFIPQKRSLPKTEQIIRPKPANPEIIELKQKYKIKKLVFMKGFVALKILVAEIGQYVEVKLENEIIRPELNSIISYFNRIFNSQEITVFLKLAITKSYYNEIISCKILSARSPEIDRLNEKLIENIKTENFFNAIIKPKFRSQQKNKILTIEELTKDVKKKFPIPESYNSNTFLMDILKRKKSKHFYQLDYLSKIHQHEIFNLRFSLKPFAFLFLVKGDACFHYVLETVDQKLATYIWHVKGDRNVLKEKFKEIEKLISLFESSNRLHYKSTNPKDFTFINHDYSSESDGFVSWKTALEKVIKI